MSAFHEWVRDECQKCGCKDTAPAAERPCSGKLVVRVVAQPADESPATARHLTHRWVHVPAARYDQDTGRATPSTVVVCRKCDCAHDAENAWNPCSEKVLKAATLPDSYTLGGNAGTLKLQPPNPLAAALRTYTAACARFDQALAEREEASKARSDAVSALRDHVAVGQTRHVAVDGCHYELNRWKDDSTVTITKHTLEMLD